MIPAQNDAKERRKSTTPDKYSTEFDILQSSPTGVSCRHMSIGEPYENMSTPCAYDRVNGVNCCQIAVKLQRILSFSSATEPTHSDRSNRGKKNSAEQCGEMNAVERHGGTTEQDDIAGRRLESVKKRKTSRSRSRRKS